MVQFEMYFTNEYLFDIVNDLTRIMNIFYDRTLLQKAFEERDNESINNLFVARDSICKEYFVCVDCNNKDWIFPLIVKCSDEHKIEVNKCMLDWDNEIREEYGQELTEEIFDSIKNEDSLLKRIESFYQTKI